MDRILLIGHGLPETQGLRKTLEKNFPEHQVVHSLPLRHEITKHLGKRTKLTILNNTTPFKADHPFFHSLRSAGYNDLLLILSKVKKHQELNSLKSERNAILLEKPFSEKDLLHLSHKILKNEPTQQRLHRRYRFCDTVGLESFGVSGKIAAKIKTISKGGAFLQLQGFTRLNLGDFIRIHLQLRTVDRYHMIPAQIVNSENQSEISPSDHFGVAWLPQFATHKLSAA